MRGFTGILGVWTALLATVWGAGCSTDVALNAPYEERSLAFCLLDPGAEEQWVRVNRTWLGEGNNLDIAMVADSSEYAPGQVTVTVEQFGPGDIGFENPLAVFTAQDTVLQDKDDAGIFYGPEYRAYHFETPDGLEVNAGNDPEDLYVYRMTVSFADGRLPMTAVTTLIGSSPGNISNPPAGIPGFNLNFASGSGSQVSYPNINFKWSSTAGAKRYEASIEVMFTERIWVDAAHTQLASETERVLRWDLGEEQADDDEGGQEIKLPTNGEAFFQFLASRLEEDPFITRELGNVERQHRPRAGLQFCPQHRQRRARHLFGGQRPRHRRHSGAPGLHQHLRWLGLFASRTQQSVDGLGISKPSVQELVEGPHTAALQFCLPPETEGDVAEYACP